MMNPRLYCRECGWHPHYRSHRAALRAARRHHCPPLHSLTDTAPLDAITNPETSGGAAEPNTATPSPASASAPPARPASATPAPQHSRQPSAGRPGAPRWWQRLWHTLTHRWRPPVSAGGDRAEDTTPEDGPGGRTRP